MYVVEGGIKSKDLEMRKKIKGWKEEKRKLFEDLIVLVVPDGDI